MAWLVDFKHRFNQFAFICTGFFGFNFYSWLLPLILLTYERFANERPQLIRAKVVVYFLATSWISFIFLVIMAWRLDEWGALPIGLIIMFTNSIYIVALTAFLLGLGLIKPSSTEKS